MYTIARQELSDLFVDFLSFADANSHLTDIEAAEEFTDSIADSLTEEEVEEEAEDCI
jgi:hypothetical protein